uniref:Tetratricopeptide repeat domain 7A n=1 Tax=Acanthochromis polyacanthus TaxID=80966 RepID=A0A3Q1ETM6_9TELE
MASRVSFTQIRLEADLERCRAECQWDKMPAIIEQMTAAHDYGTLLMAEALLEECLQENMDLLRSSVPLMDKTQPKLSRAKGLLNTILSRGRLTPRYLNEALLLMAKVHYVQGRYRDAQGMCARVGLEELTQDDQPIYHFRLLAEAFVIKGTCYKFMANISRIRLSEREEESLSCYLRACDAALSYLQELDRVGFYTCRAYMMGVHVSVGQVSVLGTIFCFLCPGSCFCPQDVVEEAVLLLLITESMVRHTHTHSILSLFAFKAQKKYVLLTAPAHFLEVSAAGNDSPTTFSFHGLPHSPPLPHPLLHSVSLFVQASGEAVISRLPDQAEARQASLQDATSVYDLLTIGMARRGQYAMLSECLERAMKFSFKEFHLWHQLGLSLMAAGKGVGAVSVFKECARMRPEDPSLPLLAVKVCIGQLHWYKEAEALAQSVVSMGEEAREFLPRAYLALGLCCSLQASDADRNEFNRKALQGHLSFLHRAHSLDPQDAQIAMYLALQLALVRQPLQAALSLRGDDLHSLHLLILLLSAQKHHRHALDTLSLALSQHPDNFNLLFTKVKLEEALFGPAAALQTCEEMLQCWQTRYDVSLLIIYALTLGICFPFLSGSLSPTSVAVSRLEAALSEVSDMSSIRRQGPTYIWATLERIWLIHLCTIGLGYPTEAQFCIAEASSLFPNSHSVLLQRGRLAELRSQLDEAKGLYDEALALHPTGEHILVHMGRLLVKSGRVHLGEKVLRDAVQVHSTSHEAWSGLGEALQSRDSSQAPDCFLTALELEASCPIRPFTIIPREI